MPILAATTGLFDIFRLGFGLSADRLSERDFRLADVGFDFEFTKEAIDTYFKGTAFPLTIVGAVAKARKPRPEGREGRKEAKKK